MEAVTNATAIIALSKIGRLDLFEIFDRVITTPEVRAEVLAKDDLPGSEIVILQGFIDKKIKVVACKQKLPDLGDGEATAIPLCIQEHVNVFISDDKLARWSAQALGIKPTGVLGIILENARKKRITKDEARSCVLSIEASGLFLTSSILAKTLREIDLL